MTKSKKPTSSAGLEGVIAAETALSEVNGNAGRLIVAGQYIEDLAPQTTYEEAAALMWEGLAPVSHSAKDLQKKLGQKRVTAFKNLSRFDTNLSILESLRAGWSDLADHDDGEDYLRLVALAPVLIANHWREMQGKEAIEPDPEMSHVADFLRMLHGTHQDPVLVHALETYLVTVMDHGMNASTFTARVVASTQAGMVSSIVAAVCALKGPLHGGAPGPVLDMLDDAKAAPDIRTWLERELKSGERLMGFGHRIYRTRDPRADVLKDVILTLKGHNNRVAFAEALETEAISILAELYPDRQLETNVEFYTALVLEAVGLPRALFTPAFAMGRVLGWTAHVFEQEKSGRIIRPASRYVGTLPAGAETLAAAG